MSDIEKKTGTFYGAGVWRGGRFRVKGGREEASYYHVMSQTCGASVFFDETEKEAFRRLLWKMSAFLGVEICTFCVMGNHFHVLVRVPSQVLWLQRFAGPEGEAKLLAHLRTFYTEDYVEALEAELDTLRQQGRDDEAEALLNRFRRRFCDLSLFCKEVKERFSRWFNQRHERRGTLWSERFRSVLVEEGLALSTIAAYIDLNPVRAGLVEDPKDYAWSGYAEAVEGRKRAIDGLCRVMSCEAKDWETHGIEQYFGWLMEGGGEIRDRAGKILRRGFDVKAAAKRLAVAGKLKRGELVLCRVKYATAGLAWGSAQFVQEKFAQFRPRFGPSRRDGARVIPESATHELTTLRRFRNGVVARVDEVAG